MKLKYRVVERLRNRYSVAALCDILEVSRSGYYAWRKRQGEVAKDQWLVDLIVECQQNSKQTYGCRRVRRWLEKVKNKKVNIKAIRRIMRKHDLLAQIRRRKPYAHYKQAVHRYPNLLERQFDQAEPNKFWVTDITYIPTGKGMVYMCAVMDLCGKMVLAYRIGTDMTSSLVTDTVRDALNYVHKKGMVTDGLALHSDQGSQYTSKEYFDLSLLYHFSPSMSTPGCPYDNASMENFFGTLKVECLYRRRFANRDEVDQAVSEYVHFYNFQRINLKNGLTPFEIRSKAA